MAIIKKFVDEDGSTLEAKKGVSCILIKCTDGDKVVEVIIEESDIIEFIFEIQDIKKQIDNE